MLQSLAAWALLGSARALPASGLQRALSSKGALGCAAVACSPPPPALELLCLLLEIPRLLAARDGAIESCGAPKAPCCRLQR